MSALFAKRKAEFLDTVEALGGVAELCHYQLGLTKVAQVQLLLGDLDITLRRPTFTQCFRELEARMREDDSCS
jgi:hypothetical protein